jgi:hypothetical protein
MARPEADGAARGRWRGPRPIEPVQAVQSVSVHTARRFFLVLAVTVTVVGAIGSSAVFEHHASVVQSHRAPVGDSRPSTMARLCTAGQRCAPTVPVTASGPVGLSGALAFVGVGALLLAVASRVVATARGSSGWIRFLQGSSDLPSRVWLSGPEPRGSGSGPLGGDRPIALDSLRVPKLRHPDL